MTYCHLCRHVHLGDDARMVERFTPAPVGFRANYDGAPLRETRSAAVADMCARRAGSSGGSRNARRIHPDDWCSSGDAGAVG